jgi:peptidoglycan/LPS O-acetylase OafA/YrhL
MASLANNETILKLAHTLQRTFRFIKPSFLSKLEPEPIHRPTDFLDGLRGFAALFVFNYHCLAPLYPDYRVGFWSKGGLENDYWITQYPIIRSFYAGPVCVLLFFVLSGFSITLKPLKLARQGKHEELLHSLVSATFRRACRLYLPCLGLLAMVLIGIYLGFFDHSLERSMSYPFLGKRFPQPTVMESGQFKDLLAHVWYWSDPVSDVKSNSRECETDSNLNS